MQKLVTIVLSNRHHRKKMKKKTNQMKSCASNKRKMLNLQKAFWSSILFGWMALIILETVSAPNIPNDARAQFQINGPENYDGKNELITLPKTFFLAQYAPTHRLPVFTSKH